MDTQTFKNIEKRYDYHFEHSYGTEKFTKAQDDYFDALDKIEKSRYPVLERVLSLTEGSDKTAGDHLTVENLQAEIEAADQALKGVPNGARHKWVAVRNLRTLRENLKKRQAHLSKFGIDLPANTKYSSYYTTAYNRSGYASKRIRAWLTEQNIPTPKRGHIPSPLIEHYIREHEDLWEVGEVWTSTPYTPPPAFYPQNTRPDTMQIGLWCYRCADTHARTSGIPTQRGWDVHQSPRTPGQCNNKFFYTGRADEYRIYDPRPIPEWERELRAKYMMS